MSGLLHRSFVFGMALCSTFVVLSAPADPPPACTRYPAIEFPLRLALDESSQPTPHASMLSTFLVDLDGDGTSELLRLIQRGTATDRFALQRVDVALGGAMSATTLVRLPDDEDLAYHIAWIDARDVDGDALRDLVLASLGSYDGRKHGVYSATNRGDGSFASFAPVFVSELLASAAVGDFDGDQRAEVLTSVGGRVVVYQRDAAGTWAASYGYQDFFFGPFVVADFDHDGDDDVAGRGYQGTSLVTYHGDPLQPLGPATATVQSMPAYGLEPYAFDADHDGWQDLFLFGPYSIPFGYVARNDAGREFDLSGPRWDGPGNATKLRILDVDGDGDLTFDKLGTGLGNGMLLFRNNQIGFVLAQAIPLPLYALAIRDVDRDGTGDLIVRTDSGDRGMTWLRGDGRSPFSGGLDLLLHGRRGGYQVSGDLNGDGRDDLVVAQSPYAASESYIDVLLSQVDGSFLAGAGPENYTSIPSLDLWLLDLDGDRRLDLFSTAAVTAGYQGIVAYGRGDGTFERWTVNPIAVQLLDAVMGDLDGDGSGELVVRVVDRSLRRSDIRFEAYRTSGRRFLRINSPPEFYDESANGLAVADIDRDGRGDLVFGRRNPTTFLQELAWYRSLPGGGFDVPQLLQPLEGLHYVLQIVPADLDQDGLIDLFVLGEGDDRLRVYRAQAGGGFRLTWRSFLRYGDMRFQLRDVDHDTRLDLVGPSVVEVRRGDGLGGFLPAEGSWYFPAGRPGHRLELDGDGALELLAWNNYGNNGFDHGELLGHPAASDTAPPLVRVVLRPLPNDEVDPAVFDDTWQTIGLVDDDCSGAPTISEMSLRFVAPSALAIQRYLPHPIEEIRTYRDPSSTAETVVLQGPSEAAIRARFAALRASGRVALIRNGEVILKAIDSYGGTASAQGDAGVVPDKAQRLTSRWTFSGARLQRAAVSFPGGDLIVNAVGRDDAGREGTGSASLVAAQSAYCASAEPGDVICSK